MQPLWDENAFFRSFISDPKLLTCKCYIVLAKAVKIDTSA